MNRLSIKKNEADSSTFCPIQSAYKKTLKNTNKQWKKTLTEKHHGHVLNTLTETLQDNMSSNGFNTFLTGRYYAIIIHIIFMKTNPFL